MDRVRFGDLAALHLPLREELDAAYKRVMDKGWFITGEELETFEREFATYCRAKHAIGVANGLEALHLLLRGYDIGAGDEVIVPANTFIATWLAVSQAGAQPVPVEPDPFTYNIDPARVEKRISPSPVSSFILPLIRSWPMAISITLPWLTAWMNSL